MIVPKLKEVVVNGIFGIQRKLITPYRSNGNKLFPIPARVYMATSW